MISTEIGEKVLKSGLQIRVLKARGLVYINLPWYSTLSLYGDGRVYLLVNHAESADRYINVNTYGSRVADDFSLLSGA